MHKGNQSTEGQNGATKVRRKFRLKTNKRALVNIVAAVVIFSLGWIVGGNKLSFRSYSPSSSNVGLPDNLDYSSVDTIYDSLKSNFDGQLDEATLLDGLKAGLAKAAGDPYTEYFNASDADDFNDVLDGKFEGIGAVLGKDEDKNIVIISPLAGYPAEKAGLKPKDIIANIDGKSAYDLSINEAVKLIRGDKGTTVKLSIVRAGVQLEIDVTREEITVPSVESKIQDGIGILTISRFADDTAKLTKVAAQEFKDKKVKGVILDLRSNPGGLLDAAVSVSSLWLKNKTVLTERRDGVIIETFKSSGTAILNGVPTVVLINEGSASASEIMAGALRDNNAATLVGVKSYGKGSVQQPIGLIDGSLLKVTIARWFTPSGKNIDKEGIEPDQKVEITAEDVKAGIDSQLNAAISHLNK